MKYQNALIALLLLALPIISFGQSLRELVLDNHYLYVPSAQGRLPTIIAVPGCSGISSDDRSAEASNPQLREDDLLFRRHYRDVAERLEAEGYVVLLLNINTAEGLLSACASPIDGNRIADYIDEAIAWSSELSYVDPENLHIIGWSMGGRGVLTWLDGSRDVSSVRSATAIYPPCDRQTSLRTSVPILILLGGSDDIADPSSCENLVNSVPDNQQITVRRYPGARHGFDIEAAPAMLDIGNGLTVGYQRDAATASWTALLRFLSISE